MCTIANLVNANKRGGSNRRGGSTIFANLLDL